MSNVIRPDPLRPDPLRRDLFIEHTRLVDTVTAAGVPAPDGWTQLRHGLRSSRSWAAPRRCGSGWLPPSSTIPTPTFRRCAPPPSPSKPTKRKSLAAVCASVLARLRVIYTKTATDNYAKVVEIFDGQADRFVATTRQVDVETPAVGMVDQCDRARKAWLDAERDSLRLTALIRPLHAAARLTERVPESAGSTNSARASSASHRVRCGQTPDLGRAT
jgi:hypothetical protein